MEITYVGCRVAKDRALAFTLLFGVLFLASCSSMVEDPFTSVGPRPEYQAPLIDSASLEVLQNQKNPYVKEAVSFLASGEIDQASGRINKALKLDPENSNLHLINGIIYQYMAETGDKSRYSQAEIGYKLSLKNNPSNYWANYLLGLVYFETRDYDSAQQTLSNGLLYYPDDGRLMLALASASYNAQDIHTALLVYNKLGEVTEFHDAPYYYIGALIHAAAGNNMRAELLALRYEAATGEGISAADKELQARLRSWQKVHSRSLIKHSPDTEVVAVNSTNATEYEADSDGLDEEMLYIDVIILRSEESSADNEGINLLNGLQMSFKGTVYSKQVRKTESSSSVSTNKVTEYFSPVIDIPSVYYMLNIFNNFSTKTEIIARPTLIAMNGKKSEFHSGSDLHVALTPPVGNSQPRLETIPVGLRIDVKPTFSSTENNVVDLEVNVERTFIEEGSQLVTFGNFAQTAKNGVSAHVRMAMGETLILGGLQDSEILSQSDKVRGLGDVPLLKYLFSEETTGSYDKSVIIMMTPRRPVSYGENQSTAIQEVASEGVDFLGELKQESDWLVGDHNLASILEGFQRKVPYSRGFRADDLPFEKWSEGSILSDALVSALAP
jgi:tetratricopeptide (TPR) repeat protein